METWIKTHGLKTRLDELPLILCGPMLRRVEPNSVSVFVALKDSCEVTLTIYQGLAHIDEGGRVIGGLTMMQGTAATVYLGDHLHVVVVTARHSDETRLKAGNVYSYDLRLDPVIAGEPTETLRYTGLLSGEFALGYSEALLPSFSLPPIDLNSLRIIHGSCRKPNGQGQDALVALDIMIEKDLDEADHRPHQLFLTGDQVYVDEVADDLLGALTDAGDTLLGWSEFKPAPLGKMSPKGLPSVTVQPGFLRPGHRTPIVFGKGSPCGFTTQDHESHLLTLAEYFTMYLFVWSPVLWPTEMPKYKDIYPNRDETRKVKGPEGIYTVDTRPHATFKERAKRVAHLRSSLHRVRRALASVPSYMIFDDHDITDDWNLNLAWCKSVYSKELGRRVIQNGLLAYAVFQGWGNTPERFEVGPPDSLGRMLLSGLSKWSRSESPVPEISSDEADRLRRDVNTIVGIPDNILEMIQENPESPRMPHIEGFLDWDYTVNSSKHEVIVLDTRMRRGFPGKGDHDFASLISSDELANQIPVARGSAINDAKEITIIVSAAPVIGIPRIEEGQRSKYRSAVAKDELDRRDPISKHRTVADTEAWGFETEGYESLLSHVASKVSIDENNEPKPARIVFLSGDVHYSFAARIQYWAERLFTQPNLSVEAIFVQLNSSAQKNQDNNTKGRLHVKGYKVTRLLGTVVPTSVKNVYQGSRYGWINPRPGQLLDIAFRYGFRFADSRNPIIVEFFGEVARQLTSFTRSPDWRYRMDWLIAETEKSLVVNHGGSPQIPAQDPRQQELNERLEQAAFHKQYAEEHGPGKEIVGVNNIGEITFQMNAATILSSDISRENSVFEVASSAGFPKRPFYIIVNREIMKVGTASRNSFSNILRGVGGTLQAEHSSGTRVNLVETVVQEVWWRLKEYSSHKLLRDPFPVTKQMVSIRFDDPRYPQPIVGKRR